MTLRRMVPSIVLSGLILFTAHAASRLVGTAQAQATGQDAPAAGQAKPIKTLLLVGGEIHDWKGVGDVVEAQLKTSGKFDVTRVNNDLDALKADRLESFDLVVFYWTLGTITEEQKRGLMNFVAGGKGFATFHSGADSFRGDPDYRAFVGGYFISHPAYRQYQVSITEEKSPITAGLDEFLITDEQYLTDYDPRVKVLANALHKGKPWPVLWTKDWGKGRVFYSALGHDAKACQQEMFKRTLLRGAQWAAGWEVKE
ncbi:MAG TPA: ThuA domain-containing protein [Phycisphaerae bacterium]|jgi:type 1 glutamine amidotransferase|nr:ThuA domain-containing protein [Phycisphaerae bacterium]HOB76820.1 ThuA domain-containing protein [Phycisphaerae bacterium]HOJ56859.1 ThuA domain-containing protein [Phycisphaerae bacterium]HOL28472.1 ThuA domain-containing protein [Phycisphaerae bacterium]HPP22975.1 ThuA domain-containing protein [Phycisphaerae bacterium]